jgi:protease I
MRVLMKAAADKQRAAIAAARGGSKTNVGGGRPPHSLDSTAMLAMEARLAMSRKILLVTGDGGDSYETLYAYHRFLEAGWEPIIAAPARRRLHMLIQDVEPGWDTYTERAGHSVDAHVAITAVAAKEFAAVVILGGRAPEYLRNDASLLSLAREFAAQDKCICAIGHGIQVLTAAGLTKGRTVTCHEHVQVDVERDGGHYVSKPAVRDGKLITAESWTAHPEFYREIFACLED